MVQVNPSISWQSQWTHQYLAQHSDECFGCTLAEHVLAMQWSSRAAGGWIRAAACSSQLAKNPHPDCRDNSLGFGLCMQQPCQIRHDRSISATCKSCWCQGNCAGCGYKHLPAWGNSCRHSPGKQSRSRQTAAVHIHAKGITRSSLERKCNSLCLSQGSFLSRPGQAEDAAGRDRQRRQLEQEGKQRGLLGSSSPTASAMPCSLACVIKTVQSEVPCPCHVRSAAAKPHLQLGTTCCLEARLLCPPSSLSPAGLLGAASPVKYVK